MHTRVSINIGNRDLIFETGKLAKLSNGSATVQYGDTVVLAAADAASEPKADVDFLPLTIDYRERMYAAGKIPGGFFKREGRPTEKEILTARLIDRPLRTLFDKNYFNEVQIMATVFSADGQNSPDILAMNAASAALAVSSIPFFDVMGAVRVGRFGGEFVVNPLYNDMDKSDLDVVVAATREHIVMVECGAKQIPEHVFLEALKLAHDQIRKIISAIEELRKKAGKAKGEIPPFEIPSDIRNKVIQIVGKTFDEMNQPQKKEERAERRAELWEKVLGAFESEESEYNPLHVKAVFEDLEWTSVRDLVLTKKKRADGRSYDEIRPLHSEVGVLPRAHGSAVFTRGQTQSLGVATLGTGDDEQRIDALEGEATKYFMLHYNFPAFSVGEVRPNRGVGRREVGHGALAERALAPVLPPRETFPYTIRMVSDILESNGSSSMASVCSCTLALMDAGIPITSPVAGIAMGLIQDGNRHAVLTDIAGMEDHLGDMDFKVAGTEQGITAVQVDLKISGLAYDIIEKTLDQAKKARLEILAFMAKTLREPRSEISMYAPKYTILHINPEKIKVVIGPGGKMIKEITKETGAKIDIEDDGKITIFANDAASSERAVEWIRSITAEAEVGKIYQGKVKRLLNFGAFCEILPGVEGLVHVSEFSDQYVARVENVVKIGDEFPVKVVEIDDQGRVNLSAKQAGAQFTIQENAPAGDDDQSRPHHRGGFQRRPGHGGDRSHRRDHHQGPRSQHRSHH